MSSKFFGNSKDKTNNIKNDKVKNKNRSSKSKNSGVRKVGRGK